MFSAKQKRNLAIMMLLAIVAIAAGITACIWMFGSKDMGHTDEVLYEECDFKNVAQPYDINPGKEYVLYTNYACPYCATLYQKMNDRPYTTRLLLLDNKQDSPRFATQDVVSAFMLKLCKLDVKKYEDVEKYLFDTQDSWVTLDERGVLAMLNGLSNQNFTKESLQEELNMLHQLKSDKPEYVEHVPTLLSEGKNYSKLIEKVTQEQ